MATIRVEVPGHGWFAARTGAETGHMYNNGGRPLRVRIETTQPAWGDTAGAILAGKTGDRYELAAGETLYVEQTVGMAAGVKQFLEITPD